jgi:hypothetical protein
MWCTHRSQSRCGACTGAKHSTIVWCAHRSKAVRDERHARYIAVAVSALELGDGAVVLISTSRTVISKTRLKIFSNIPQVSAVSIRTRALLVQKLGA